MGVTARLANGSVVDLTFDMFRLSQKGETKAQQLPVCDPKGDFWFKIAILSIVLGVLSLFVNVCQCLLCRSTSSPVARSRLPAPRARPREVSIAVSSDSWSRSPLDL